MDRVELLFQDGFGVHKVENVENLLGVAVLPMEIISHQNLNVKQLAKDKKGHLHVCERALYFELQSSFFLF